MWPLRICHLNSLFNEQILPSNLLLHRYRHCYGNCILTVADSTRASVKSGSVIPCKSIFTPNQILPPTTPTLHCRRSSIGLSPYPCRPQHHGCSATKPRIHRQNPQLLAHCTFTFIGCCCRCCRHLTFSRRVVTSKRKRTRLSLARCRRQRGLYKGGPLLDHRQLSLKPPSWRVCRFAGSE